MRRVVKGIPALVAVLVAALVVAILVPGLAKTLKAASSQTPDPKGSLLGIGSSNGTLGLLSIDPDTGATTPIGDGISVLEGDTINLCFPGSPSALDSKGHRFYFYASQGSNVIPPGETLPPPPTPRLFVLDTQTGALVASPAVAADLTVDFLAFDTQSNTLLGIGGSNGTLGLLEIDPTTGTATPIGSAIPVPAGDTIGLSFPGSPSALDSKGQRFYFYATEGSNVIPPGETVPPPATPRLFELDTQTGALVASPTVSSEIGVDFLAFDTKSKTLLGIGGSNGMLGLLRIDPTTGVALPVGSGIPIPEGDTINLSFPGSPSALDSKGQRFYFYASEGSNVISPGETLPPPPTPRLFVLDTQTGILMASPAVSSEISMDFLAFAP